MSVYLKLMKVQNELKAPKSQFNKFGNYNYRNCEDILEAVKPILIENKALIIISDEIEFVEGRYYVRASAVFIDAESGEKIKTFASAREVNEKKGMDGSQITGSSSSYARKYALNGLLLIDDTKDADYKNNNKDSTKYDPKKESLKPNDSKQNFKKDLGNLLVEMYGKENASKELLKLTTFKNADGKEIKGKSDLKDLSDRQAEVNYIKLKNLKEAESKPQIF